MFRHFRTVPPRRPPAASHTPIRVQPRRAGEWDPRLGVAVPGRSAAIGSVLARWHAGLSDEELNDLDLPPGVGRAIDGAARLHEAGGRETAYSSSKHSKTAG